MHTQPDARFNLGLIALVVWLLACVVPAAAQTDTVWVRQLSGTGNGDDKVRALAVGPDNSVYALVQNKPSDSAVAIITAKYSSSGQLLWSQRFEGDGYVIPADIAVDASGDVFVTGSARRPDRWYDMVTLKYTASGDSSWVRYYDAEGNNDEASAVVVDGEGSAYVVGYGESNHRYEDMALVKYSSTGEELWAQLYDFQENEDFGLAAAIDSQGYVYEVGLVCNWQGAGDYDMQVLKYSPLGTLVWARTFAGPGDNDDSAVAVTVDPQNNVVVAGCTHPNFDSSGYLLVKYNSAGETLWSRSLMGSGDGNGAVAVAADAQGNVIVAGNHEDAYLVVKYSPAGTELWQETYHGPSLSDRLAGMGIDPSGSVYVTGRSDRPRASDVATLKYSSSGETLWTRRWDSEDTLGSGGLALAVVGTGVCVGGFYERAARDDTNGVVIRYDGSGNRQWEQYYSGPGRHEDAGQDVTFDQDGNVIAVGYLDNTDEYEDLAVVKYSPSGELLWYRTYCNVPGGEDVAVAVATDSWGNVLVTGYSEGAGTDLDYVTLKYDPWGNEVWVNRYNGPGNDEDEPVGIAVGLSGSVIVTGTSYGDGTYRDFATVCYSASGQELWVRRYNGVVSGWDYAGGVATDGSGAAYVAGRSCEGTDSSPATVIKYNSSGEPLWVTHCCNPESNTVYFKVDGVVVDGSGRVSLGGDDGFSDRRFLAARLDTAGRVEWVSHVEPGVPCQAYATTADGAGRVYVTGRASVGSNDYDYLTIAFSPEGEEAWMDTVGGSYFATDCAYDVAASDDGRIFVTGKARNRSYDAVTVCYDTLGTQVWVDSFNSPGDSPDRGNGIAVGPGNRVAVTGYGGAGIRTDHLLVVVYEPRIGLAEPRPQINVSPVLPVRAYPNPSTGAVRFTTNRPVARPAKLQIYDRAGRLVRTLQKEGGRGGSVEFTWDGTDASGKLVPAGVYFCTLGVEGRRVTCKVVLTRTAE